MKNRLSIIIVEIFLNISESLHRSFPAPVRCPEAPHRVREVSNQLFNDCLKLSGEDHIAHSLADNQQNAHGQNQQRAGGDEDDGADAAGLRQDNASGVQNFDVAVHSIGNAVLQRCIGVITHNTDTDLNQAA